MADESLTSAYAYRWQEQARPMLNIYHYRGRYGIDDPQFGVVGFECKKSNKPGPARGTLGKLPVEILHKIFLDLDIFSLAMVRELNAYYKRVLDGLYEFKLLKQHASETFRIMYAVEINKSWNLSQIFAEFTHPRCRTCDNFGPFIFLLTFSRCCYNCLLHHWDYELAPAFNLAVHYMIPNEYRSEVNILRSLRNDYGTYEYHSHYQAYHMASVKAFSELSHQIHGSTENRERRKAERRKVALEQYNKEREIMVSWHSARLYGDFPKPPEPVRPACLFYKCFDKETLSKWRFMASTTFPYWDIAKQKLETGAYCSACTQEWEDQEVSLESRAGGRAEQRYHQAFLEEELSAHFRQCAATREGLVRENHKWEHFPYRRSGENSLVEFDDYEPSFDINCPGDDN